MFLLLLRDSVLLLIFLIVIPVKAEVFSSNGTYFFPTNISEEDCYFKAQNNAIKAVMEKAGLSYVVSSENLNCSEIKDKNTCEYFQDSQIYYEGGFITSKKFSNNRILFEGSINRKCSVHLVADIKKFKSKHDPNYILEVNLNNYIFRDGDEILINGETNLPSNVYLFNFVNDSEEYQLIIPNKFEKLTNLNGPFNIPSNQKYKLVAKFPIDHNKDIIQEQFMLLITKTNKEEFKVIDIESSVSLLSRLNDFGRKNWKKIRLSYFIIKE